MKRVKVKMIGSGTRDDPYRVDLPTYNGIRFDTDEGKVPPAAKAIIDVPDDEVDNLGKIKRGYLKVKYRGSKWETHDPDIGTEEPA